MHSSARSLTSVSSSVKDERHGLGLGTLGPALRCALLLTGLLCTALALIPSSASASMPAACHAGPDAPDQDGDGVPDECDNCALANPLQHDVDRDGVGNVCDLCLWSFDPEQSDRDGDGLGDACDPCPGLESDPTRDTDGDGVHDGGDNCLYEVNPLQRDSDGDGLGNACDADLDGDGLVREGDLARITACIGADDALECQAADLDGNGRIDANDVARAREQRFSPPGPSCAPAPAAEHRAPPLDSADPRSGPRVAVQSTWILRGDEFNPSHGTCHDMPFEHVQALAMLPDRGDGLNRWLLSVSEDDAGWLAVAEAPAGRVLGHGHRSAGREGVGPGRVVWSVRLDGGWHGLVYNHPGDVAIAGTMAVIAAQNLRGGEEILGGIDTCRLDRNERHPRYTDDGLLFLDLSDPHRPRFLGRMKAREIFREEWERAGLPADQPLEHKWVDTVSLFTAPSERGVETVLYVAGRTIETRKQMSGPRHERLLRSVRPGPEIEAWQPLTPERSTRSLARGSGHFRRGSRHFSVDIDADEYSVSEVAIEGDRLRWREAGLHRFHADHESIEACGFDAEARGLGISLHRERKAVGPHYSLDRHGRPRISCIGPWTVANEASPPSFQINLNLQLAASDSESLCRSYRVVPHVDGLWREPVPMRFEGESDASSQRCVVRLHDLGLPRPLASDPRCAPVGWSVGDSERDGRFRLEVDPACPGVGYVEGPGDGVLGVLEGRHAGLDPELLENASETALSPRPRAGVDERGGYFSIRVRRTR